MSKSKNNLKSTKPKPRPVVPMESRPGDPDQRRTALVNVTSPEGVTTQRRIEVIEGAAERVTVDWLKPRTTPASGHPTLEAALLAVKNLIGLKFTVRVQGPDRIEFTQSWRKGCITIKP